MSDPKQVRWTVEDVLALNPCPACREDDGALIRELWSDHEYLGIAEVCDLDIRARAAAAAAAHATHADAAWATAAAAAYATHTAAATTYAAETAAREAERDRQIQDFRALVAAVVSGSGTDVTAAPAAPDPIHDRGRVLRCPEVTDG